MLSSLVGMVVEVVPPTASAVWAPGRLMALTDDNTLLFFNAATPDTIVRTVPITGLPGGYRMVAMDVRPTPGIYLALAVAVNGSTGRAFTLNELTGVATALGAAAFSTTLPSGGGWAGDYSPTGNVFRLVHSTGANYRLNITTGALIAQDTNITASRASALGYDRSTSPPAAATTLFSIDSNTSQLAMIGGVDGAPSPNGGTSSVVGALGVLLDSHNVGLDLSPSDLAFVSLRVGGNYGLYTINLVSGAATLVGAIGNGDRAVIEIAVLVVPSGSVLGLVGGNTLIRFDADQPSTYTMNIPITGLPIGETVVALDVRPATGELMAIGQNGSAGHLYRIDPVTGAATLVSATPFSTVLPVGGHWSADFNPTVDRIRVVRVTGTNLRVNPNNAALAGNDVPVGPAVPSAVAYDRNSAPAEATTLFAIDAPAATLNRIGGVNGSPSANGGATSVVGPLGVATAPGSVAALDVSATNEALATLNVAGLYRLYSINLVSGAATAIGVVGTGAVAINDIAFMPAPLPAGAAQYTGVTPVRLLDTREGGGPKPGPAATIDVQVTGVGGVPATATAVVMNVTGTEATADGFVTVYPFGETRPLASSNNLIVGGTKANLSTVKIGAEGKVRLFTQSGAHLVVDLLGYYAPPSDVNGRFHSLAPYRLIDTRESAKVAPAGAVDVQVLGVGGVPTTGVQSVVVNVTGTDATLPGYLTAYASGESRPGTSNLNLERSGGTVSNLAIVPVNSTGKITVFSQSGAHIVVDVAGWYGMADFGGALDGLFVPLSPTRVLDTREGVGAPLGAIAPSGSIDVTLAGAGGLPATGASAAILNVTSTDAPRPGFLTVYPAGVPLGTVSSLNVDLTGLVVPNLVAVRIGVGGRITIFDHAGGNVVADAAGWFT